MEGFFWDTYHRNCIKWEGFFTIILSFFLQRNDACDLCAKLSITHHRRRSQGLEQQQCCWSCPDFKNKKPMMPVLLRFWQLWLENMQTFTASFAFTTCYGLMLGASRLLLGHAWTVRMATLPGASQSFGRSSIVWKPHSTRSPDAQSAHNVQTSQTEPSNALSHKYLCVIYEES